MLPKENAAADRPGLDTLLEDGVDQIAAPARGCGSLRHGCERGDYFDGEVNGWIGSNTDRVRQPRHWFRPAILREVLGPNGSATERNRACVESIKKSETYLLATLFSAGRNIY